MRKIVYGLLLVLACLPYEAFAFCRPGETVWTDSGVEGQVEAVFPDGRVSVRIYNTSFTLNANQLATRGCWRGLCSGQNVITSSGVSGVVNGVFPSGEFSVKISSANFKLSYEQLGWGQREGDLCAGETVWTRSGVEGTVAAFYLDGQISVRISSAFFKLSRDQLAKRGCNGQLCSGDSVITTSGVRGVVNGIFPDYRTVSVKISSANFALDSSQLARVQSVSYSPLDSVRFGQDQGATTK